MFARHLDFLNRSPPGQGTTLIEVLIGLTLSLFILGMAISISLAIEHQNELLLSLTGLHDHARIALQRLEMEIQAAGFIGCPRLAADFPWAETGGYPLTAANTLVLASTARGDSSITVWHRSLEAAVLEAPIRESSVVEIATASPPKLGAVWVISDCRHAELFQIAAVRTAGRRQQLRTHQPLQYRYAENAEVGALERTTYAVEKTGHRDEAGRVLFALYSTDVRGHKSLLVEGIENLVAEIAPGGRGVAIELQVAQNGLRKKEYAFVALRN